MTFSPLYVSRIWIRLEIKQFLQQSFVTWKYNTLEWERILINPSHLFPISLGYLSKCHQICSDQLLYRQIKYREVNRSWFRSAGNFTVGRNYRPRVLEPLWNLVRIRAFDKVNVKYIRTPIYRWARATTHICQICHFPLHILYVLVIVKYIRKSILVSLDYNQMPLSTFAKIAIFCTKLLCQPYALVAFTTAIWQRQDKPPSPSFLATEQISSQKEIVHSGLGLYILQYLIEDRAEVLNKKTL